MRTEAKRISEIPRFRLSETDEVQNICKMKIVSNAIKTWIDPEPRHHLAAIVICLFQTVKSLILVTKGQVNDRLTVC